MKKSIFILSIVLTTLSGCVKNADWDFPDFDYSIVYFSYQSPVRTITLGEDIYDNTLDNQHKCQIMATIGGVYENKKDITVNVVVDNSLCQNLKFGSVAGDEVLAMPSNYYSLPSDMKIIIPSGKMFGGIEVQLTDAFFNDPRSIKNTYVIPLRITSVSNADSVLVGQVGLGVTSPDRRKSGDWRVVPKDYILYAVKYINPFHGFYLRRGIDEVKGNGGNTALDTTVAYHKTYVEQDEVAPLYTKSMVQDTMSLIVKNKGNANVSFGIVLNFTNNGDIAVSAPASAPYTVSGTGKFVKKGDMWGNEKRDVMHLKYQVDFGTTTHNLTDTLVMRDRGVKFETFTPVVN
jgi:hypothetical protein